MPATTTTTAPSSATGPAFWRGFRDGLPFILGVGPFGMIFGVLGAEAGLNLVEVMSMAVLIIAGASQLTIVAQMQENAPVFMVMAAALAVNLRMAMYSAALAPHLGDAPFWKRALAAYVLVDNVYAVSAAHYERRPDQPVTAKYAYYFGNAVPCVVVWYLATLAGAMLGQSIPPEFGLDFAVPIAFLSVVAPLLRTIAHVAAALTAMALGLALAFLPYSSGLLIAAAVAMLVGAEIERRLERRRQ